MNDQVIGTCSLCGGSVVVPSVWWGVVPPTPTCRNCGAIAAPNHGPVVPMQPAPKLTWTTDVLVPQFRFDSFASSGEPCDSRKLRNAAKRARRGRR